MALSSCSGFRSSIYVAIGTLVVALHQVCDEKLGACDNVHNRFIVHRDCAIDRTPPSLID